MVHASRTRIALSTVPQNQSNQSSAAFFNTKSDRDSSHTAASCFVELPIFVPSPHSMHVAQVRAGLKRKKVDRDQLGRSSSSSTTTAKSRNRPSASIEHASHEHAHESSAASAPYRAGHSARRRRTNKSLSIIASPHLPRDKPSSSASEQSDWSSVMSVSPTSSRAPTSRTGEPTELSQARPGMHTRRSSRGSLYRTLDGMTLEESRPIGLGVHQSSRSQSLSLSRQSSNSTAVRGDDLASGPPRQRAHRAVSSSATVDSDHSSHVSADMDDEEAEHARLISSAPTWQLHRLRKDELIRLCRTAGAWEAAPTEDERELLTKQDLVNQIITCRSRLDRTQSSRRSASGSIRRNHREANGSNDSQHSHDRHSDDLDSEDLDENDGLWMGSSSRRASQRSARRSLAASSSNSIDDRDAELTDASNEAGGEETEAEPHRLPHNNRRHLGRSTRAISKSGGTLRRMDSATFDGFEPTKANQPPRRQLRDKTSLRGTIGRHLRTANGSEPLSASTSSSIFGGRSSRTSNTSHSPFQRQQLSVFVASSPIRTRSRAARLTLGLPTRRKIGTRSIGSADTGLTPFDPMATPKLGNSRSTRAKKTVKFHAATPNANKAHIEDEWMEDLSDDSEAVIGRDGSLELDQGSANHRTSRRAVRTRRPTADSDASLTSHQPRSRSASIEAPAGHEVELQSTNEDDDADMATSDEDAPTPTKFRKLRNGKLRLVAGTSRTGADARVSETEPFDDVDMGNASESGESAGSPGDHSASQSQSTKRSTESPEGDTAASESLEDVMVQPSFAVLTRLRKSDLEQLCLHRDIDIDEDDKKANLIKKLLDWHQLTELEAAGAESSNAEENALGKAGDEADDTLSDISTVTATAEDETTEALMPTPTRRPNTRAVSNAHPSATDSDQPLLLRARGKAISSDKLPTPPLTSNNEDANPPQTGDGVDELNGLDLESLNLTDKEISPSKLEKLEKIGSGGFKDVYVGKYRISKTRVNKVAIADIRDQLTEMDIKELSLLRDLRHENIVRFIGVSIPEDPRHVPCMIVSELCSNGDLFDYIRNTSAPCDAEVFRILLETARGLEYLHTRTPAIIHRDCKSTNVLITRRKTAKINDFGLARVKNTSRSMMRSLVGTVNWQAVELWVPKPHYNEKVDVWSAAMTFWEALQWHQPEKKYPFQGMNEHQIYQDVGQKRQRPYTGAIRRQFGGEIVDLLDRMWDQTTKNRPTMTEVCNELEYLIQMKKETANTSSGRGKA